MKILAVDNEPKALIKLVKCLEEVYPESDIEPFYDPMLAVKYAFNNQVDVVFTELYMKRIDGIQVKSIIQEKYGGHIPVYFVTTALEAMGKDGQFVTKPVSKEKFINIKLEERV